MRRLSLLLAMLPMLFGALAFTTEDRPTTDTVGVVTPSSDFVEMSSVGSGGRHVTLNQLRNATLGDFRWWGDGSGIDVAIIDTGVSPVDGLDDGRLLHGPDLSNEGGIAEIAYLDSYGHGTHLAGIIAGDRNGARGIAPEARIVSVKVAGRDGVTTVPQVVAAIDWVIEHGQSDGLNIRVLNLSLGLAGVDDHRGDLLSAAVERAWDAGIFVVVAAGNNGDNQKHLDSPAIDPYVMAVGAIDTTAAPLVVSPWGTFRSEPAPTDDLMSDWSATSAPDSAERSFGPGADAMEPSLAATVDSDELVSVSSTALVDDPAVSDWQPIGGVFSQFTVPSWSATGDGDRNPDSLAAGRSIASYRVPGSTIDELAPDARIGSDLFRGSGTSQSAAVVSGLAARLLSTLPALDNDDVKATFTTGTLPVDAPIVKAGNGHVDGNEITLNVQFFTPEQDHPRAAGDDTGLVLPSGATWSGGTWSGATWSGATWSGATWSGGTWSGATWSGATWSGATWSGATWSGATWSGATWSGATWSGATWSGATWSGAGWAL